MWGRHGDTVVPQDTPSSQRPHHDPKPALPGLAWEMGHAAGSGAAAPAQPGGLRGSWGRGRDTGTPGSPEDSGSAPGRLCRHGHAPAPAPLPPRLRGSRGGSATRPQRDGAQPCGTSTGGLRLAAGLGPARRDAAPTPCHVPHASSRRAPQLPRQPGGHGPLGPGQSGGGGKRGTGLSQSRAGCLFKCWRGARRGLFICRECWLPAPRRRKRIQRNKAGPPGKALGRGRDGHGPARPPRTQLGAPTGGRTPHSSPSSHQHPLTPWEAPMGRPLVLSP